jgi:hypothetical protein
VGLQTGRPQQQITEAAPQQQQQQQQQDMADLREQYGLQAVQEAYTQAARAAAAAAAAAGEQPQQQPCCHAAGQLAKRYEGVIDMSLTCAEGLLAALAAKEGAVAALENQLARSMARLAEQVGLLVGVVTAQQQLQPLDELVFVHAFVLLVLSGQCGAGPVKGAVAALENQLARSMARLSEQVRKRGCTCGVWGTSLSCLRSLLLRKELCRQWESSWLAAWCAWLSRWVALCLRLDAGV